MAHTAAWTATCTALRTDSATSTWPSPMRSPPSTFPQSRASNSVDDVPPRARAEEALSWAFSQATAPPHRFSATFSNAETKLSQHSRRIRRALGLAESAAAASTRRSSRRNCTAPASQYPALDTSAGSARPAERHFKQPLTQASSSLSEVSSGAQRSRVAQSRRRCRAWATVVRHSGVARALGPRSSSAGATSWRNFWLPTSRCVGEWQTPSFDASRPAAVQSLKGSAPESCWTEDMWRMDRRSRTTMPDRPRASRSQGWTSFWDATTPTRSLTSVPSTRSSMCFSPSSRTPSADDPDGCGARPGVELVSAWTDTSKRATETMGRAVGSPWS
mmetsp:Transcript_23325/g.68092  ORF Transcript_23325/g.68092 Transcript_23325/m.68092 type:complete len:332 (-) Transcript_23325:652-1647(-)